MDYEITFSAGLKVSKDGAEYSASLNSKLITMAGSVVNAGIQKVGTSTEALAFGDVTAPGYIYLRNLDESNFVMVGLEATVTASDAFLKLLPGEAAVFPTRLTAINIIADTAECNVQKIITSL